MPSASRMESHLVKPLHRLEDIPNRLVRESHGEEVRLTLVGGAGAQVDPAKAVEHALADPIEYPPLETGIVPGDRVAIAIDSAVPRAAEIVRGAIHALKRAGVDPEHISVVTVEEATADACRKSLRDAEQGTTIALHNPADENDLCLVGTTQRGEPLLINRAIFDADVVLPIGCARASGGGVYESLYPRFSSAAAIERARTPNQHKEPPVSQVDPQTAMKHARNGKLSEEEEAGWMIGVAMTVQVVPGANETVAHVVAGEPRAVAKQARELCRSHWLYHTRQRVSLLIAAISGGPATQTWQNVGRALAVAEDVLEEGGAVAICSNLAEPLGHSLGRLASRRDFDSAAQKIANDHDADSWTAWRLARALQRGPVYLMSQLDDETVEDLGLAPVETIDDLVRLAGRHDNYAVITGAQHVAIEVGD
ncbi:MAG: DUF2088 domain-containing protein [Pirellulales bacterium]|nr:DUF2088 domain-containing protein [Pirellulales bacterium]